MDLLKNILRPLRAFSKKSAEFTIEANPESLTSDKLSLFLDEGVNRISIGVQSFDNSKLNKLGRIHDDRTALKAVESAVRSGFKNVSIDLIFGVWDESLSAWKKDLEIAASLPVTHISCYGLTYEEGSQIGDLVKAGAIVPLEEETSADMYRSAISYLAGRGFAQYEISNFSKSGFMCRHNLAYWNNDPYIGLGPSAVSYIDGVRQENIADTAAYIEKAATLDGAARSSERLSPEASAKEAAAVKIRTIEGIDFDWFKKKTGFEFQALEEKALAKLTKEGLVEYGVDSAGEYNNIHLTPRGILLCDIVSGEFL